MKKCFLLFAILAIALLSYSQNQVITVQGDTIYHEVLGLYGKNLSFKNSDFKLNVMDVSEVFGKIPKTRLNTMLRHNPNITVNGEILPVPEFNDVYYSIAPKMVENLHPSGTYIKSAGNYYLTGTALAGAAAVVTFVAYSENSKELKVAAAGLGVSALVCQIIGHVSLVKAGKSFTKESLTISPAQNGIGFAINF